MAEPKRAFLTGGIVGLLSIGFIAAELGMSRGKASSIATRTVVTVQPKPPASELGDVWKFCVREEFRSAEAVAMGVEDKEIQRQLLEIIAFSKARSALSHEQTAEAARIANELPASFKHSLILIATASQQSATGDTESATASLRHALVEVGDVSCGQRSRLLAGAGRVYMRFDAEMGRSVLRRAVAQYKGAVLEVAGSGEVPMNCIRSTPESFYEVVRSKTGQAQVFPLHLPSLPSTIVDESVLDYLPTRN